MRTFFFSMLLAATAFAAPAGPTSLADAAMREDKAVVRTLLSQKSDVNATQPDGSTALLWAAAENHAKVVKLLIARGANINARSSNFDYSSMKPKAGSISMNWPRGGFSALLFAAREGSMESLRLLLDAGADINLADPD